MYVGLSFMQKHSLQHRLREATIQFDSTLKECKIFSPLVLRLGVDAHHARVAVGDSLAIIVFVEKGLQILNIRCS